MISISKFLPGRSVALWKLAFVACIGLSCGCQSSRPIRFGIYSVPAKDLSAARSLGIDFVVGPGNRKYLDAARDVGLQVIGIGTNTAPHPALLGAYLTDEPDLFDIHPEIIALEYRQAKSRSLGPVFLNLSSSLSIEFYAKHADQLMFDWYPVGWRPIETFFSQTRSARLAAGTKPFFATVQLFDWSRYPMLMAPAPHRAFRRPAAAEVRAMAMWAAMNGAAGIAFYPFDDGHTKLSDSPELFGAVQEAISFIRANQPVLSLPRVWGPYPFDFINREDQHNAISEASIAIKYARMPGQTSFHSLIAANTTGKEIMVAQRKAVAIDDFSPLEVFGPYEVKFLTARFSPESKP